MTSCVRAAGPIDVLINNAGYELAGAVEETAIDELVAHTVPAAIESRKPRLRYAGREAQLVSRLRRWLPEAAYENGEAGTSSSSE